MNGPQVAAQAVARHLAASRGGSLPVWGLVDTVSTDVNGPAAVVLNARPFEGSLEVTHWASGFDQELRAGVVSAGSTVRIEWNDRIPVISYRVVIGRPDNTPDEDEEM